MMTEKINNIRQIIRSTEEYSDVCDMCRDEILLYPTISGRTEYSQDEVEQITLKRIIDKLRAKEQECEELKREIAFGNNGKLSDKIRAIVFKNLDDENSKYKQALDEIEEFCIVYSNNHDAYETVYKHILDIINKAKEKNNG